MPPDLLTIIGSVLGIAGVQILRDWRDGKSVFRRNGNNLGEKMNNLSAHYNEETTPILGEIRDEIKELNQIHKNYEIIGIKTRECAKEK